MIETTQIVAPVSIGINPRVPNAANPSPGCFPARVSGSCVLLEGWVAAPLEKTTHSSPFI